MHVLRLYLEEGWVRGDIIIWECKCTKSGGSRGWVIMPRVSFSPPSPSPNATLAGSSGVEVSCLPIANLQLEVRCS